MTTTANLSEVLSPLSHGKQRHNHHNPRNQQTKQPPQQQQQPHKKQVRRRLHTSRPYQERLLNMAEARREIVTALKFHRAAMKQAKDQQQQKQNLSLQQQPQSYIQEPVLINQRNLTNLEFREGSITYPIWSNPPPNYENLNNFALPNQTLGLNLNFNDFNLESINLYINTNNPPPSSTTSRTSSSSSSSSTMALHQAMDDDEMAEMRTIGEQHQMEWNDTMNLMTSAWWFKFLHNMEEPGLESDEGNKTEDRIDSYFEEVMEFPSWLNPNDDACFDPHFHDYCSQDCNQDPALPCMDIGEFEGMDGDWLA